jgi:hypothetical protein
MSTTSTKSPTKKPKPSLSPEQAQSLDWLIERATLILRDEKGVYARYDVLLLPQTMPYEGTLVGFDGLTPRVVFGRIKEVKIGVTRNALRRSWPGLPMFMGIGMDSSKLSKSRP